MRPAVVILGATGAVGRGVVRAAAEAGWSVVAVARDPRALEALRTRHPEARLRTVAGSVATDASAAALVAELHHREGPFAGVIAALGAGSERGRLLEQPAQRLRDAVETAVVPHLAAARHLLPWLAASGRNCGYVLIGGPGSRHPWAGYGHRSIAAAALQMLARVLHAEALAHSVRLQLLEVESPARTGTNEKHACGQWPCVDHIGHKALALLSHRNRACCAGAVVDFAQVCDRTLPAPGHRARNRGDAPAGADVEPRAARSSAFQSGNARKGLTLESLEARESTSTRDKPPQEMDSDTSLLPSRCLQDVRKLLENFPPFSPTPTSPTNKHQEPTK